MISFLVQIISNLVLNFLVNLYAVSRSAFVWRTHQAQRLVLIYLYQRTQSHPRGIHNAPSMRIVYVHIYYVHLFIYCVYIKAAYTEFAGRNRLMKDRCACCCATHTHCVQSMHVFRRASFKPPDTSTSNSSFGCPHRGRKHRSNHPALVCVHHDAVVAYNMRVVCVATPLCACRL